MCRAGFGVVIEEAGALRFPAQKRAASIHPRSRHGGFERMTVDVALCARQSETRPSLAPPNRGPTRRTTAHARPDARPTLAPWQVRLATQIMQRDFSEGISILDIACQCRLSLSHFIRAFSNTVGTAPYAWCVQKRVQHAEALLTETHLPIVQIALECGFTDQAHFTKAFAKANGTTPARWRRQPSSG